MKNISELLPGMVFLENLTDKNEPLSTKERKVWVFFKKEMKNIMFWKSF